MSPKTIVIAGCRLIAIVMLVQTVPLVSQLFSNWGRESGLIGIGTALLSVIVTLLLAPYIATGLPDAPLDFQITLPQALHLALVVIGIFLLMESSHWLTWIWGEPYTEYRSEFFARIIIGLIFVFAASPIANFITPKEAQTP